jgi:glycosyltransferase involved in cell wall biosynthesis
VGVEKPILDECLRATRTGLSVVTISPRLREHYIARGGEAARIHVVPDGVDLGLFSPRECESSFEGAGPHVVYCGHLYDYKGVPTVLEAAGLIGLGAFADVEGVGHSPTPPRPSPRGGGGVRFHLVGGSHEDQTRVRATAALNQIRNVRVHGHVPHSEVAPYLWHANVLLLPPSAKDPSANWTSPVKLGEYLASGRPIVASAIPGLKDWVDAPAVRWFEPDDARSLADAIVAALSETPAQTQARQAAAAHLAKSFSYPNRAGRILESLATRVSDRGLQHVGSTRITETAVGGTVASLPKAA